MKEKKLSEVWMQFITISRQTTGGEERSDDTIWEL
jgi:hypothetical protein